MVLNPLPLPPIDSGAGFACWSESIELVTTTAPEFIDLTERVEDIVARSPVTEGLAVVFSRHTTAAITLNELEPLLLEDMAEFLDRLAPKSHPYRHNDFDIRTVNMTPDESPNGHSHCLQLALGSSQTIPIRDGRMVLGQWQRIFMVELDRSRPREAVVQTFGLTLPSHHAPVGLRRNGSRTRAREA
ncbi:MAG: YjbQ family protein [Chloroflexi bacterium]|nr:YjbQ family protein [Chloroflexota bacterium]